MILAYITRFRPKSFLLENVKGLLVTSPGADMSDADWIVKELEKLNYYVTKFVFDCGAFGSIASRTR
eukprot:8427800-Prorocentrum_lima.AAC.1